VDFNYKHHAETNQKNRVSVVVALTILMVLFATVCAFALLNSGMI
jgi:hypothetical protein